MQLPDVFKQRWQSLSKSSPIRERWRNFRKSSAIHQGLLSLGIFLLGLLLLFAITRYQVQTGLNERLKSSLEQETKSLIAQVEEELDEDNDEEDELLQYGLNLRGKLGQRLPLVLLSEDLKRREYKKFRRPGFTDCKDMRCLITHRNGRIYVVGQKSDDDILEIISKAFLISGLGVLALTSLLVLFLSRRSHHLLKRITGVLGSAADGDLTQRFGSIKRNDDLAQVGDQIDTMLTQLESSMLATKDISANIAHELKTPISRLRHSLGDALDIQENGGNAQASLEAAYEESGHITETFNALLRIAQIEGGARRANFASVDLAEVIDTAMDIYTDVAEDAGMTLTKRMNGLGENVNTHINGDRELLVQLLANLIENAIRYCPEGTTITIALASQATRDSEQALQLAVSDNGPGIPAEERERVFQRLYRLEKSRTDGGLGLGLSLVKAIVELHSANVTLDDNKPGLVAVIQFEANRP